MIRFVWYFLNEFILKNSMSKIINYLFEEMMILQLELVGDFYFIYFKNLVFINESVVGETKECCCCCCVYALER